MESLNKVQSYHIFCASNVLMDIILIILMEIVLNVLKIAKNAGSIQRAIILLNRFTK